MSKRPTPSGEAMGEALSSMAPADTLILEQVTVVRTIAGGNRTTHKTAESWLCERRKDGTLGWVLLRVDGRSHYVIDADGEHVGHGVYVHPGGYDRKMRWEPIRLTLESRDVLYAKAQNFDQWYWVRADKWAAVIGERDAVRQAERDREKAVKQANADVPKPLRELLRLAGVPAGKVHVSADDEDVSVLLSLTGDEARAVNAVLSPLLPVEAMVQ